MRHANFSHACMVGSAQRRLHNPLMTRILLIDDHAIVREGFKRLFEGDPAFDVVGEAGSIEAAVQMAKRLKPDVAIVDLSLGAEQSGLNLIPELRLLAPAMRCIVVSMHDDPAFVARALEAGAEGYATKAMAAMELLPLVHRLVAGERVFSSDIVPNGTPSTPLLTPRELELLAALVAGEVPKSIAMRLDISDKTLYRHRANLMAKLGARQPTELSRIARERGLLGVL